MSNQTALDGGLLKAHSTAHMPLSKAGSLAPSPNHSRAVSADTNSSSSTVPPPVDAAVKIEKRTDGTNSANADSEEQGGWTSKDNDGNKKTLRMEALKAIRNYYRDNYYSTNIDDYDNRGYKVQGKEHLSLKEGLEQAIRESTSEINKLESELAKGAEDE